MKGGNGKKARERRERTEDLLGKKKEGGEQPCIRISPESGETCSSWRAKDKERFCGLVMDRRTA